MLLAIDAGNTNIVFALCEGSAIRHSWRCKTDAARTADEYASWLYPLFQNAGVDFGEVKAAIISSVVPDANYNLRTLCRQRWNCDPLFAGKDLVDIKINLPKPEEAGADRLVNASAVVKDYGSPAIVIDFGTATTFDVVNKKGEYCGGVIAPGINLSLSALNQAAAKLPRISIGRPTAVMGNDTISAMQSGIYWGYTSLIEGLIKRLRQEIDGKPHIIATGGLASLFAEAVPEIDKVDPDLTLRGLIYIYQRHTK